MKTTNEIMELAEYYAECRIGVYLNPTGSRDSADFDRSADALRVAIEELAQAPQPVSRHIHKHAAMLLIDHFLCKELDVKEAPSVTLERQGESEHESHSWAFWILENDTTSYLHEDGRIEWCGTAWINTVNKVGEMQVELNAPKKQEPFGYVDSEDLIAQREYPHSCRGINLYYDHQDGTVPIYLAAGFIGEAML